VTATTERPVPLVPGPTEYYPAIPGPRSFLLDSLAAAPGRRSIYVEFYDPDGLKYGMPTYPWRACPDGWLTRRQLAAAGLRPGGQLPAGQCMWRHHGKRRFAYLYLRSLALKKHPMTPAMWVRHHAMMAARMTCQQCDGLRPYCMPRTGLCNECAAAGSTS
jgi:hypothetical protein